MTKTCSKCQTAKPLGDFHKCARARYGVQPWCKPCQFQWVVDNREKRKAQQRAWYDRNRADIPVKKRAQKYGITVEELRELLKATHCECCGRELSKDPHAHTTHIDHCHATGKIRGVTCRYCNVAIGQIGDDPEKADAIAAYLRRNK